MSGNTVTDVANQSLDAIGWQETLGDIEDGSHHGQILLRAYRQDLQQLLRSAEWNFARKQAPLQLLADASGNTPNVGTIVPQPWVYEYAYPTDCARVRFVPWNPQNGASVVPPNNIQIPQNVPLTGGLGQQLPYIRLRPAKFVVATDFNYPAPPGSLTWDVQGVSPEGRTVILTNVRFAQCVYTAFLHYPSVWDPLFRAALVAYIAAEVALPIWAKVDRKFGLQVRGEQIQILKAKVMEARMIDGSEGVPSSDIRVDWMDVRRAGGNGFGRGVAGGGEWFGGGDGFGGGYDSLAVPDGSVF